MTAALLDLAPLARATRGGVQILLLAGAASTPCFSVAQTAWIGGAGDWFDGASWSQGVPNAGVDATIANGGTVQVSTPGAVVRRIVVNGTSGSMRVENGGTLASGVNSALASGVGIGLGSFATAVVDGAGSRWTHAGTLNVGTSLGIGTLQIQNGGAMTAGVGEFDAAFVRVQGAGSSLAFSGALRTGLELTISGGGTVGANEVTMRGSSTSTVVDGAGSLLTMPGFLFVGETGSPTLTVRNGAAVNSGPGYLSFGLANPNTIGTVVVDGAGSIWTNQFLVVGGTNRGILNISNGGAVVSGGDSYVGYAGGTGTVTVDGPGSSWVVNGDVSLGDDGTGTLNIRSGGRVAATSLTMGRTATGVATLNVGDGAAAGQLDVASLGVGAGSASVTFNHTDAAAVPTAFSGALNFSKRGAGILQMNGASSYSGPTGIEGGTLRAGAANAFSPNSAHSVSAGATLDLAGFNQTLPSLTNSGTVSTVGSAPGTSLTVTGPYVGNNGVLRLGTRLGDSASATDQLVLDGPTASASGSTTVQITNLGGLGAATTGNGIEVISARNGATTTAQTTQNAFTLANGGAAVTKGAPALQATTAVGGHVDAGAYEYRLYAADANGAGENWYLRSTVQVAAPAADPPPLTPTPTPPAAPAGGVSPLGLGGAPGLINVIAYRTEVPLYASLPAQLRRGNLAMLGNRRQRIGDDDLAPGAGSGGAPAATALGERRAWGRLISTKLDIRQGGTVSPASDGRLSGFQAGTDLFANRTWRAGIYVGRLEGDAGVSGFASGIANQAVGSTDLRSHYFGGYGTWTGDNGWYADAVLQAGRHRYRVQPHLGLATSAKGSSLTASIEVGKAFDLGSSGNWKVEPSVQLAHQRLSLDDSTISGAVVQNNTHNGWIARAGVRVKGEIATGAGLLQPYGRLNVYRTSSGNDVARFIGPAGATDIASAAGSNSTELAGGFTLALNDRTSLYAEAGKLWASGGGARVKSGVQGSVGLRVHW